MENTVKKNQGVIIINVYLYIKCTVLCNNIDTRYGFLNQNPLVS